MTREGRDNLLRSVMSILGGMRNRGDEGKVYHLGAGHIGGDKAFNELTDADGYRYRVTVESLGKVRKPLPTKDGTLISWSSPGSPYPDMARLEGDIWHLVTAGVGIERLYSAAALQAMIPDEDNWKVVLR